ncbi:MAG: hypothetical protein HUU46_02580 [Candidatus Hydrogenedentes bacterium]|nr:hypothetical protein [Candidatus Hydrogenedentota bacterium]
MGFFLVLKAEVVRTMIISRRYWFATMTALIVACIMFTGFFYGFLANVGLGAGMAGVAIDKALGLIIGIFAFSMVGMFSTGLAGMARSGELEQVYMSPHGLITNFMARSTVSTVLSIVTWTLILSFMSASFTRATKDAPPPTSDTVQAATIDGGAVAAQTGEVADRSMKGDGTLHADPLPVSVLFFLTYFSMTGFGFMIGGLVLVFKQVGQIAVLLRFAMIAIAWTASDALYDQHTIVQWIAHIIPVTDAAICLKLVLLRGIGNDVFTHTSFYCLIANVAIWTPIGLACFKAMENWARSKGTLGAF